LATGLAAVAQDGRASPFAKRRESAAAATAGCGRRQAARPTAAGRNRGDAALGAVGVEPAHRRATEIAALLGYE
jgi:hypothetical protein